MTVRAAGRLTFHRFGYTGPIDGTHIDEPSS